MLLLSLFGAGEGGVGVEAGRTAVGAGIVVSLLSSYYCGAGRLTRRLCSVEASTRDLGDGGLEVVSEKAGDAEDAEAGGGALGGVSLDIFALSLVGMFTLRRRWRLMIIYLHTIERVLVLRSRRRKFRSMQWLGGSKSFAAYGLGDWSKACEMIHVDINDIDIHQLILYTVHVLFRKSNNKLLNMSRQVSHQHPRRTFVPKTY